MGLAGALEIVGGILIILGLFTRLTAFVLAGFWPPPISWATLRKVSSR